MRPRSLHRGENCADVAIPLIAAGGCRSVSAGALAGPLLVTPAAVLKWFGSTARLWEQIADAVGRRWCAHLQRSARLGTAGVPPLRHGELDPVDAVRLLLPLDDAEVAWTRVWLSLLEHGRHHDLVGERMAEWEAQEMEVLHRATGCRDVPTLTSTLVVVRGLRQMVASTHGALGLETAHDLLHGHVLQTYPAGRVPEPATEADALASTSRFSYLPSTRPPG